MGLRELAGIQPGEVVFISSPNTVCRVGVRSRSDAERSRLRVVQIFYPAFYLGAVCAGAIFTGGNPAYGEFGEGSG